MNNQKSENVLRVAFPSDQDLTEYDPAKILYTHQYILLENLYSQLLAYDTRGEIVSGLAERFEWRGNSAVFTMRRNLLSSAGQEISADDVIVSLKRLFILQSNTHGDLSRALCGEKPLRSLADPCDNIAAESAHTVVLRFPRRDPFLFAMLTSVDFSVIPAKAIDPKTLKILDYGNTSGPYYAAAGAAKGEIELLSAKRHFQYSESMPQRVQILPAIKDGKSFSLQLFRERKVDMVTTAEMSNSYEIARYSEESGDANYFRSVPIKLAALTFTPTGISRLPEKDRFIVAAIMRQVLLHELTAGGAAEATPQLFPPFGQGALSREQLEKLGAKTEMEIPEAYQGRFTAWNLPKESWPELRRRFPNAEFKHVMALPGRADYKALGESEPELFFHRTDTSIKEDISFFSYYMNGYFFSLNGEKGGEWVRNYASTEDLKDRMRLFNKLHYDTLYGAVTIPLTFSSYVAAVRKPWRLDFFSLHAGTTFWRMKWD